jgi:hypothetical protein
MRPSFVAAAVFVASTLSLLADQPSAARPARNNETRKHFLLRSDSGLDDYEVTVVDQISEERLRVIGLVLDKNGKRYSLTWDRDFVQQTSSRQIRLLGGDDEFLRYTMYLPFTAKTRTATMAEAHAYPELTSRPDKFEFAGPNDSRLNGEDRFWDDPDTALEWRKRIRAMVPPSFLESLEMLQVSGLFRFGSFTDYAIVMPMILYRTECESAVAEPEVVPRPPRCDFDDAFGFGCSDAQKERAEKALGARPPAATAY